MKTIPVKVLSATKLSKKQLDSIENAVKKKYPNNSIKIETIIDKKVVGGVKLLINTVEYDGTVRGKLDKLQAHLTDNL